MAPFTRPGTARIVTADYARRYRTLHERHWWWRSREALVLGWVERLHRRAPRRRILDVGCGDGLLFDRLSRFGEVDGLEPDASLVQDPRWRGRIRTLGLGPGLSFPVRYDLVMMLDVLEHIADDLGALRAACAALRPGGHLLLTVPALRCLWSRHDEANAHHRRYGPQGLLALLDRAGFVVETTRFAFAWTVAPLLARRLIAPARGEAGSGVSDYQVTIPPPALNRALACLSRADHELGRLVPWPVGGSLLAVARNGGPP